MEEITVFPGKTLADLFQDVYQNSVFKRTQIQSMISELQDLVKTSTDAAMIVPMIKEYLDVSVKNDESIIKVAQIVQRLVSSTALASSEGFLSEEEKKQLMGEAQELITSVRVQDKEVKLLEKKSRVLNVKT